MMFLVACGIFMVLGTMDRGSWDRALQDESGNGVFHKMKRDTVAIKTMAAEQTNDPTWLDHQGDSEKTSVSGSPGKNNRLQKVIEDSVDAVKNLPTRVGHRIRPNLAPSGVYFTLAYLSVPSPFGVTGLTPGTRVVCVKDEGAVLLVKMGNLEFEVKRQYLTNDLDVADLAFKNDVQAQQAVKSAIAEQQAMDQARRDKENAAFDQEQRELEVKRAVAAASQAAAYSNPLDRGAYNETFGVSGPPSVGGIIVLPQSSPTQPSSAPVALVPQLTPK